MKVIRWCLKVKGGCKGDGGMCEDEGMVLYVKVMGWCIKMMG